MTRRAPQAPGFSHGEDVKLKPTRAAPAEVPLPGKVPKYG